MNSKVKFKLKTPIIIFAIVALIFGIISSVTYFVDYDYSEYRGYKMNIVFPSFTSLISLIIALAPIVLFLVYIKFRFYRVKIFRWRYFFVTFKYFTKVMY